MCFARISLFGFAKGNQINVRMIFKGFVCHLLQLCMLRASTAFVCVGYEIHAHLNQR